MPQNNPTNSDARSAPISYELDGTELGETPVPIAGTWILRQEIIMPPEFSSILFIHWIREAVGTANFFIFVSARLTTDPTTNTAINQVNFTLPVTNASNYPIITRFGFGPAFLNGGESPGPSMPGEVTNLDFETGGNLDNFDSNHIPPGAPIIMTYNMTGGAFPVGQPTLDGTVTYQFYR